MRAFGRWLREGYRLSSYNIEREIDFPGGYIGRSTFAGVREIKVQLNLTFIGTPDEMEFLEELYGRSERFVGGTFNISSNDVPRSSPSPRPPPTSIPSGGVLRQDEARRPEPEPVKAPKEVTRWSLLEVEEETNGSEK